MELDRLNLSFSKIYLQSVAQLMFKIDIYGAKQEGLYSNYERRT
jgi:hypothetical protein